MGVSIFSAGLGAFPEISRWGQSRASLGETKVESSDASPRLRSAGGEVVTGLLPGEKDFSFQSVWCFAVVVDKVQYESATGKTKKEARALAA
ncbi:hypothetical protein E2320_019065, partial [Naja naja]